jgi:hypothetical protein
MSKVFCKSCNVDVALGMQSNCPICNTLLVSETVKDETANDGVPGINGLMFAGTTIMAIQTILIVANYPIEVLRYIVIALLVVNIIGFVLSAKMKGKAGVIVYMIGCIPFVPLGLIGVYGARKQLDALTKKEFGEKNIL